MLNLVLGVGVLSILQRAWRTFRIFFFFFLVGGGEREETSEQMAGGVGSCWKSEGGGGRGGGRGGGEGQGAGSMSAGGGGGGGLNIFFSGRSACQERKGPLRASDGALLFL